MNIEQLKTFKQSAEKITCLTAYDASFAKLFDECGIDVILVGDSLGNVIQGGWCYHGRYGLSYSVGDKGHSRRFIDC